MDLPRAPERARLVSAGVFCLAVLPYNHGSCLMLSCTTALVTIHRPRDDAILKMATLTRRSWTVTRLRTLLIRNLRFACFQGRWTWNIWHPLRSPGDMCVVGACMRFDFCGRCIRAEGLPLARSQGDTESRVLRGGPARMGEDHPVLQRHCSDLAISLESECANAGTDILFGAVAAGGDFRWPTWMKVSGVVGAPARCSALASVGYRWAVAASDPDVAAALGLTVPSHRAGSGTSPANGRARGSCVS